MCKSCSVTLREVEKDIFNRQLQSMSKYKEVVLRKTTRLTESICVCYICLTTRYKEHAKNKGGKGHFKNFSKEIDMTVGYHESQESEPLSSSQLASAESLKLCGKCLQEIGKGKQHICNDLKNNAQEQVLSSIMKKKLVSDIYVNGKLVNVDLSVSTGCRKKRITINPTVNKAVVFDEESLDNFKVKLGASSSQMKKVTNYLRCHVGRKCIPVNYLKHMTDMSNSLKNVYKIGLFSFECEKSANKQVRPVVYADADLMKSFKKEICKGTLL